MSDLHITRSSKLDMVNTHLATQNTGTMPTYLIERFQDGIPQNSILQPAPLIEKLTKKTELKGSSQLKTTLTYL